MSVTLNVNGVLRTVPAAPDTPLLYVLRNDLELNAAKFGCGLAQCGACTVLLDGQPIRSCVTPASSAVGHKITTVEGLGTLTAMSVLQQAFVDEQAAQCGYCVAGVMMTAKALLDKKRTPNDAEVRTALAGHLCRCGTHNRIVRAIVKAGQTLAKSASLEAQEVQS